MNAMPEEIAVDAVAVAPKASEGARMLPIASLKVDPDLDIRVSRDGDHLAKLIEAYEEKSPVPPIVVVHDGSVYRVVDGFYRVKAARLARLEEIEAKVRVGGKRDAVLMACGMNAKQLGLPRSNADKRRAVQLLLEDPDWRDWCDAKIANVCAVSAPFVGNVRRQLTQNASSERRVRTKHGTEAKMDVGQIGKRRGSEKSAPIPPPSSASNCADTTATTPATAARAPQNEDDHVLEVVVPKPETDPVIIARPDVMSLLARQPDADLQVAFEPVAAGGLRLRLSLVHSDASSIKVADHAEVAA